jgi:hypothetical protein
LVVSRVSAHARGANATIARYHQPNGGKLRHSSSPPATAALMRASRATTASPNRLTQAGTSRFVGISSTGDDGATSPSDASSSWVISLSTGSTGMTGKESVSSSARLHSRFGARLTMDHGTSVNGLTASGQRVVDAKPGQRRYP